MKRKIIAAATFVFVVVIMMVIYFNIGYGQPDKDTAQEKLVVSPHPTPFIGNEGALCGQDKHRDFFGGAWCFGKLFIKKIQRGNRSDIS